MELTKAVSKQNRNVVSIAENAKIYEAMEMGRAPPTCFHCSFYKVAVCKKFNCWSRHLAEVNKEAQDNLGI